MADGEKLSMVDFAGIDNMLGQLMDEKILSCAECDAIFRRIALKNGFSELEIPVLNGIVRRRRDAAPDPKKERSEEKRE